MPRLPHLKEAASLVRGRTRAAAKSTVRGGRKAKAYATLVRAARAFDDDDYPQARRIIEPAVLSQPQFVRGLLLLARVETREGDYAAAAGLYARASRAGSSPQHALQSRATGGRVIETDPLWLPHVPAGLARPEPLPGRVLYLAKESMPFHSNGFCTRTHETLEAVRGAGLDPVGVTMPGFPASVGIDGGGGHSSDVEGITYRHLLPDAAGVKALPFDTYLDLSTQLLAREMGDIRPDLLHIGSGHRGYETALVGRALAAWSGLPWLYEVRSFFETTWTADDRYMETAPYFHRRFATESRCMADADLVVTLSGPMRDEIVNGHGIAASRVRVIPNAVDLSRFTPAAPDPDLRAQLGLTGRQVLGYVSNLDHPREGQEVLLRAVARMRERGRDVAVLLVGEGRRRPELEQLARGLGLKDSAVFTGSVPFAEVAAHYSLIDLFVVPRVDERAGRLVSPMKPFEAMAMRVPVLVSDLPALVEIARGSGCATFEAGSPESLAAVAGDLLDHPERLAAQVDEAARWVAAERTWEANGRAFAEAYAEARTNHQARQGRG